MNFQIFAGKSRPLLAACLSGALISCSAGGTEGTVRRLETLTQPAPVTPVPDLAGQPRSYESHFQKGLNLLHKKKRTDFDLHLARVAFETAARLSRDYWPAWVYAGIVHDMLGNYEQAMNAFVQAAFVTERADFWDAAGVAALRGGYEGLAFALHERGQEARVPGTGPVSAYMAAAYTNDGDAARPRTETEPDSEFDESEEEFVCRAPEDEEDEDGDDEDEDEAEEEEESGGYNLSGMNLDFGFTEEAATESEDGPAVSAVDSQKILEDCEQQNVIVDAYIIRRNGNAAYASGIDLLSALEIQFGAQLIDFTYSRSSATDGTSWTLDGGTSISIPDVTYALSIANDGQSFVTIDASPSIVARLGEESKIFDGTEVYIVASGESSAGDFEKEIGVKLAIEPDIMTESAVTLKAGVEFSILNAQNTGSVNFQSLNTDKLIFDINGTFPFGAAVLIGKLTSTVVRENTSGQTGLQSVPALGKLFGTDDATASSRDVLVLISVRKPAVQTAALRRKISEIYERFEVERPEDEIVRYGFIHDAPPLATLTEGMELARRSVKHGAHVRLSEGGGAVMSEPSGEM